MKTIDNQKIKKMCQQNQVRFLVLFGSQALGKNNKDSDFDFAIMPLKNNKIFKDLGIFSDFINELAKTFKINMQKVDLTNLTKADPLIAFEVIQSGKLLFGSGLEYENYKAFIRRQYIETKSLRKLEEKIIYKKQKLFKKYLTKKGLSIIKPKPAYA